MNDLNALPVESSAFSEMPSGTIPVLSTVVPHSDIPQALKAALDARDRDKAALLAIEANLLQALRPEIERLSTTLVRNGVRQVWLERTHLTS